MATQGRARTQNRAPMVAENLVLVGPRSCCLRCAKDYVDFPLLHCWHNAGAKDCADCVKKKRPCEQVSFSCSPCAPLPVANRRKIPNECLPALHQLQEKIDSFGADSNNKDAETEAVAAAEAFRSYVECVVRRLTSEEDYLNKHSTLAMTSAIDRVTAATNRAAAEIVAELRLSSGV